MRHILTTVLLLLLALTAQGQDITIEGLIVDANDGQPLPYASVRAAGGAATISNEYGAFKIKVPAEATLTFSYTSYATQQIVARRVPDIVRLTPMETALSEVTVVATKDRIKEIIKEAKRQLSEHKKEKSNFFYRQTSYINGIPTSMTEAFFRARSSMMLRDMELLTGRFAYTNSENESSHYAGNLFYFSEIGMLPLTEGTPPFVKIVPFGLDYKSNYNISYDIAGDCYVLRFKPSDRSAKYAIDATLFVDINTLQLRKAVGTIQRGFIYHASEFVNSSGYVPIKASFTCTYDNSRGFCEVQSVALTINYTHETRQGEAIDIGFQSLIYNIGDREIEGTKYVGNRTVDLRKEIEKIKFNRQFWDEHETVKRSEIEHELDLGKTASSTRLSRLSDYIDHFNFKYPQEKVYVHLDNTGYFMGETIWLKAYVMRADSHTQTDLSRVLYVDLVSPTGETVKTLKLMISHGQAEGSIPLEGLIGSGFYEVRAYTRYMTNWDSHLAFSRVVPVFNQPAKEGDYTKTVIDKTDYRKRLPDYREEAGKRMLKGGMSVAFYPEGGHMVYRCEGKVAIEVVDAQGRGVATHGWLKRGETLLDSVRTAQNGRGLFSLTPDERDVTLVLVDDKGKEQVFKVPEAEASGIALTVDVMSKNTVKVSVKSSVNLYGKTVGVVLMGRGNTSAFTPLTLGADNDVLAFSRESMDDGVNSIVLFDKEGNILADRLFFVYPRRQAESITFSANGQQLLPGQKVSLETTTRPKSNFSIAIHDYDTEVNGAFQSVDSWLLLSSELRGYIADADYYLESDDATHRQATDLLMMIQGWHRYDARQMMNDTHLEANQPIEDGLFLFGQLHDRHRRKNEVDSIDLRATLFNRYGNVLRGETKTDSTGHFAFRLPDCVGGWTMQLKATKDGKPRNYYMSVDRQPALKARLLYYYEQQRRPLGTPFGYVKAADNFDDKLPMELRTHHLSEVTVKGRDTRSFWEDEETGARNAGIRYDIQQEVEDYLDKGRDVPNLFKWLKERNEFFNGDNSNAFDFNTGWYIVEAKSADGGICLDPECYGIILSDDEKTACLLDARSDETQSYVGFQFQGYQQLRNVFIEDGLSYKGRPIVWVLNNDLYGITRWHATPHSIASLRRMSNVSVFDMSEDLLDIKSIYISEDSEAWRKYIHCDDLTSRNPVTVFVYSDSNNSKTEKGVRNTYFDGFYVEAYEMPGHTEMPDVVDFRRTLYWNPTVTTDDQGKATINFYNSSTCRRISISAEGITPDGHILEYRPNNK